MSAYVLYYHRIFPNWPAPDVTLSMFEWEMCYLKKHYHVLSISELFNYINGDLILNRPGVVITFDDGWFDNFVYAYPVLKKHGLKATIFVSTGKIRAEKSVRLTLDDCWAGRAVLGGLQKPKSVEEGFLESLIGNLQEFLTWDELRIMQKSGVFDIQSHGVGHRRVFTSDVAKGVVEGKVNWSLLSASPEIKEGMPLYPVKSALASRAYYPYGPDTSKWETEEEMKRRILGELVESRDTIFSEIGHAPVHFCWPWGQYNYTGIELAKDAGFQACYTTNAGSVATGTDRYRIPRVSTSGGQATFIKRGLIYSNPFLSKIYHFLTGKKELSFTY